MRALLIGLMLLSVSYAQIVIVVASGSPIDSIKKREVERLFLAKSKRLPNGEKAIIVEPKEVTLKSYFYKKVLRKAEVQ